MHLLLIGWSHKTAPLEMREKLAIPDPEKINILRDLLSREGIDEALILSTCNRFETYLATHDSQKAIFVVASHLSRLSGIRPGDLEKYLYVKEKAESISHLFRVTAGLDSMVLGETQITGQVKEAYTLSLECQSSGVYLNKLMQWALHVAKKIRTETGIGHHPISVSYIAVLLAEKIFGNLSETEVLLIGAGEMGALAAKHLVERRVKEIWITNRSDEKADLVAGGLGVRPTPFDQVTKKLDEVDIVITSTASNTPIVKEQDVREAMKHRRNRPMFFIDIAVPRNVEPAVNQIENVYLYDLDHLQGIVESNQKEREKEARKAEEIVLDEVVEFLRTLDQIDLSPTIQQLSKKFDVIRKSEVDKYLSKRISLTSDDQEAIHACTRAIVNKILHDPILLMKTEEVRDGGMKYSEILKKLFKLE